jgi:hypothetical protein
MMMTHPRNKGSCVNSGQRSTPPLQVQMMQHDRMRVTRRTVMAMKLPGNGGITECDGSLPLGEQYLNLTEQEIDIHRLRQYPVCN